MVMWAEFSSQISFFPGACTFSNHAAAISEGVVLSRRPSIKIMGHRKSVVPRKSTLENCGHNFPNENLDPVSMAAISAVEYSGDNSNRFPYQANELRPNPRPPRPTDHFLSVFSF